ncbi:hypothetical protein AVEN_203983-1, partial [Araneus ventricosus]
RLPYVPPPGSWLGSISPVTTTCRLAEDFFDTGIQKLVSRYDTDFNSGGSYGER